MRLEHMTLDDAWGPVTMFLVGGVMLCYVYGRLADLDVMKHFHRPSYYKGVAIGIAITLMCISTWNFVVEAIK